MALYHSYSLTQADGTATSVVRPSDWNSAHNLVQTLSGNTAGQSTFSGTNIVFQGGNNVTLSAATAAGAATVIFSGPNVSQYLTTAAATNVTTNNMATAERGNYFYTSNNTFANSTHSHNLATTTTNGSNIVVGTANSAGATLAVPSFLTTAAATNVTTNNMATAERANYFYTSNNTFANSTHSHGNPTLALTNLSGTTASASNGLTISLSAGAGGAGDGVNILSASGNTAGTMATQSTGTMVIAGGNNITLSQSSNTISIIGPSPGAGGAVTQRYAVNMYHGIMSNITNVTGTAVSGRCLLFPFMVEKTLTADEIMWQMSRASVGSDNWTLSHGIYSFNNSTQIGLVSSRSEVYSFTATASNSGIRIWEATMPVTSLAPGEYVWVARFSGAATASINYSLMGNATGSLLPVGVCHPGTNSNMTHTSHQVVPFWGRHSVTTSAMPANIGMSEVQGLGTNAIPLVFWMAFHQ